MGDVCFEVAKKSVREDIEFLKHEGDFSEFTVHEKISVQSSMFKLKSRELSDILG